ncbi:MAG: neutral/alkaline non-lysosomal ceramidase N-terminal domain-containing protein [Isosphaeraceae bacterium]|nr:neutral/alkaline non-lysosomal ceramidase N-terminal domain-containing protein [Isosphaeraceae bacterium]
MRIRTVAPRPLIVWAACLALWSVLGNPAPAAEPFRAGAATTNISPWIGLSVNGGMTDRTVEHVHDELHARAVVLDDGTARIAIVVCDSCATPREVVAEAKRRILAQSKIPADHVLISATHSHTCPTATPTFQSDPNPGYQRFYATRIADAVQQAVNNLAPAKIGWGVGRNDQQVHNRRWRMKPGTIPPDPFGRTTDRVKMNPAPGSADLIEPAGPIDPDVSVVSVQAKDGRPIALLANYSLHYVGGTGPGHISADYFGAFADRVQELLKADRLDPPFVAMMSNGTSGDINNINFRTPAAAKPPYAQIRAVADELAREAVRVAGSASYHDRVTLDARASDLSLGVRQPSTEDLSRAEAIVAKAKGPEMKTLEETYARDTLLLAKYPKQVDVTIQALRIGDLGIVAIPCEVFVEIGLELKAKSPLKPTFTIELANGYNGYLPTKEQHALGGYETWRARSSYLEVDAAAKITDKALELLKAVK